MLWPRDGDLNAAFRDLFAPLAGASVVELETAAAWAREAIGDGARVLPSARDHDRIIDPDETERLLAAGWDFGGLAGHRAPLIITHSRFHPSPRPFAAFRPARPLAPAIARHTRAFGRRTVGVHIRRADNDVAIATSSTAAFLDRMRAEVAAAPGTTFFVATDSPADEARVRRAFPDRVLAHQPKSLDRGRPEAARDAVIDLYCLARTRRLLGSHWSSFSETAAAIRGIELVVVGRAGGA